MAADDAPTGADDKKKSKEHTYLMIGLGVAGLVLGYITYRALTSGGSASSTASEVPVTTPVTTSTPTTSSAPTTSSTGSGSSSSSGSSSLTSTLLQDLLAQSQSAASTAAASQTAAQQLASQQLAAAQQQNASLLSDVVTALKGSGGGGGSSGVGSQSVPGASSGPNLVALASPAAAQTAAANHQALYWIPPNSSTPEQVPLGFTTQPGDRTLYTSP